MSRIWIITICVLVTGGLLGTLVLMDPGYVQLAWGGVVIETSVWVALGVLAAVWLLVRGLVTSVRFVRRGVTAVTAMPAARRAAKAREATERGLLLWAEGDWRGSFKQLADAAQSSDLPLVNHLFAASAAQGMGDVEARDRHLDAASAAVPAGEFAISLIRAGYLTESGKSTEALALLKLLYSRAPKHPLVARRLFAAAEGAGDWAMALEVLGTPVFRETMGDEAVKAAALRIWATRLQTEATETVWMEIPSVLRSEASLIAIRVDRLQESAGADRACEVLEQALRQHWSLELIERYGQLRTSDAAAQLRRAESLLTGRTDDPALLLVLGKVALRAGDLDKAESYLKSRLKQVADAEGAFALARVSLRRGDVARVGGLLEQVFPD